MGLMSISLVVLICISELIAKQKQSKVLEAE